MRISVSRFCLRHPLLCDGHRDQVLSRAHRFSSRPVVQTWQQVCNCNSPENPLTPFRHPPTWEDRPSRSSRARDSHSRGIRKPLFARSYHPRTHLIALPKYLVRGPIEQSADYRKGARGRSGRIKDTGVPGLVGILQFLHEECGLVSDRIGPECKRVRQKHVEVCGRLSWWRGMDTPWIVGQDGWQDGT